MPHPSQHQPASMSTGHGETILVVEDEKSMLKLIKAMLDRLGYTALVATTPNEAIQIFEAHSGKINLLVTDVIMPGMNGLDLAKQLVAKNPRLNCLFMSGYTADVITQTGVLEDDVNFIAKPFSAQELADSVLRALRARNTG